LDELPTKSNSTANYDARKGTLRSDMLKAARNEAKLEEERERFRPIYSAPSAFSQNARSAHVSNPVPAVAPHVFGAQSGERNRDCGPSKAGAS
jgi:hypothetical protein